MTVFNTTKLLHDYGLFWQYPVITEQEFYNQNKTDPKYCGVPWATILDKRIRLQALVATIQTLMSHPEYYTCCQHIHFKKLIPLFKLIGITTVYSPHKVKGENEIDGIKILPCPLYAVNFEDQSRNKEFLHKDYMSIQRKYLYSFMGGYQPQYLSPVRKEIFKLNKHENNIIVFTGDWHFNKTVYSTLQNKDKKLNVDDKHVKKTSLYNMVLLSSRYSLCPSGSGPNSIRFWESLACGSIPVLLSDTLDLPHGIDWKNIIVCLDEKDIHKIDDILGSISSEEENKKRQNCLEVYNRLKNNYKNII